MKKFLMLAVLALSFDASATSNQLIEKIKTCAEVANKASFCMITLDYGTSSSNASLYIACDGNSKGSIELPSGDSAAADLTFTVSQVIAKGMKVSSCSYGNYFRPDVGVLQGDHCYLSR